MNNRMKTVMLLALLSAITLAAGHMIGGSAGFAWAGLAAVALNFGAYWFSDKLALTLHGAKEINPSDQLELHGLVRGLAGRMGIPAPRIYITPDETPNAFATGRNPENASIALTRGILRLLDRGELEGVLAHELAHIKNRDTLVTTITAMLAGTLSMLADVALWNSVLGRNPAARAGANHPLAGLLGILLAPIAAALIHMCISRTREYLADRHGAMFIENPMSLANALLKLEAFNAHSPLSRSLLATAHLFIIKPSLASGFSGLFRTHPYTQDRVLRLREMAAVMDDYKDK